MHGAGSALEDVLRQLATDGQLIDIRTLPSRPARMGSLSRPLPPCIAEHTPPAGLWAHQAAALDLIRAGRSVAIATGTASGKSLCYQLAVGEAAVEPAGGTALFLFPTKALAHDQLRALGALELPGVTAVTYDGDCSAQEKAWARRHANVVLTNPDMLHGGILPFHGRWAAFLRRLRYVVLDELHSLRGVFGTHVAHVVRRLRRLCAIYGSDPVLICCSATIGEPAALAEAITGLGCVPVLDDGSPTGERLFALWNPLLAAASGRTSAHGETARLLAGLVGGGHRAIAFTRSRRGAELVAALAKDRLPPGLAEQVRPYRGGYLAKERREIEQALWEGRVRGVAATNALELGVDVGGLDACVLDGFPGTIASMWQQAGRAGRTAQQSLAVLVAGEDALDQWFMAHPDEVFARRPEPAVVNIANPFILDPHVVCAAYERPLHPTDRELWGPELDEAVCSLVLADELVVRAGRVAFSGRGFPASAIGLRSGRGREYRIVDTDGRLIGTVDESRAFESVHPGAVYLHQGQHLRVQKLDLADHAAWVEADGGTEWTEARSETDLTIVTEDEWVGVGRSRLSIGRVEVSQQVTGYQRRAAGSGEILERVELDLPPTRLATRAFWYTIHDHVLEAADLAPRRVPGALHAAEHAGIGMLPLFTICDRWDVGGVSTAIHAQTGEATIFIYDGYVGGAGIAELGFAAGPRHLGATLQAITACACEQGCPSCVQSPKCGNWNEPLDKAGAMSLLATILDRAGGDTGGRRPHP